MSNLQSRQQKIQDRRKHTPRKSFVMEICSRFPVNFYKNSGFISRYPESIRSPKLVSHADFAAKRNSLSGAELSTVDFWDSLKQLFLTTPLSPTIQQLAGQNADYGDTVVGSSNVYLSSAVINDCNGVLYSQIIFDYCKNIVGSLRVGSYSENIYNSVAATKSMNVFFSKGIMNSNNIRYSSDMMGCSECIHCSGLMNASYCIDNAQYEKDEYVIRKKELLNELLHKESKIIGRTNFASTDCEGKFINESMNVKQGYFINRLENGHNVIGIGGTDRERNFYDALDGGVGSADMYAIAGSGVGSNNVYCSSQVEQSSNIFYSYYLVNCSFCLGCVGLKNKQFCILNKQYTKEERYMEIDKIFGQMETDGTLGSFFPGSLNPFYFNDTVAYLVDPNMSKEEVIGKGYLWRDEPIKVDIPEFMDVVETKELDKYEVYRDGVWTIDPSILKKVIVDEEGNSYRVVKMEYDFLMKYGLPLPRKHWLARIKENFRIS